MAGRKTLGGSSSINGMLHVRGSRQDFDGWAGLGNPDWSYDEVLPYFRRFETSDFGDANLRGQVGPMRVSHLRTTHPLAAVFMQAALECGIPRNGDYNGVSQHGVAEPQLTRRNGRRWSSARAFLHPVRERRNLRVETRVIAERLLVDLPAVGANLQEHCNSVVGADVSMRTYNLEANGLRAAGHVLRWLFTGRGPAASPYPHAVAFVRSRAEELQPDLQILFGPFAFGYDEHGVVPYLKPAVTIMANACHPVARGRLTIRSADPLAPPTIWHRLLDEPEDIRRQLAASRLARRLLQSAAFRPHVLREFLPGPAVQTDDQWLEHLRRTCSLGYHPVGTCRMGSGRTGTG